MIDRAPSPSGGSFIHERAKNERAMLRVFVLHELDRWTLDLSTPQTRNARDDLFPYLEEMIRIQNRPNFERRFDEDKEERDRIFKRRGLGGAQRNERRARTWTLVALRPATDAIC